MTIDKNSSDIDAKAPEEEAAPAREGATAIDATSGDSAVDAETGGPAATVAAQETGGPAATGAAQDAGLGEVLSEIDTEEALAEFASYDSLEEELAGDRLEAEASAAETDEPGLDTFDDPNELAAMGGDPQLTPKARRLAAMRLEAKVETIVFAAQKPLKPQEILDVLADPAISVDDVQTTLDQLVEFYLERNGGFRLHYLKRLGYQFQTAEAAGPIMERMFASRPRPISRAALETLAIIAYRQPVTRAEVEFIRGVDAGSIFKTLLERELIRCVGRKEIVGRPMIFGTTDQFLTVFNLSSIKDLPPLESFQPSREMVQGALARIDGRGSEGGDDLIDVEEYIADNTRGESAADEPFAAEDSAAESSVAEAADPIPKDTYGTDADSEMASTDGTGLPSGSRDLDH